MDLVGLGVFRPPLTVVQVKPREIVLAVVVIAIDNLPDRAGNALQHGDGVEEHFSVLVRQGSNLSSDVLDLYLECKRTCNDGGLLRADDTAPHCGTKAGLLWVERHHRTLFGYWCVQTK